MKFKNGSANTVLNKTTLRSTIVSLVTLFSVSSGVNAQTQLPEIIPGEIVTALKGTSLTRTSSTGGNSSLSFGANATFGTSANINTTSGTKAESISNVKFSSGVLTTVLGGDTNSVSADIGNIRANDISSIIQGEEVTTVGSGENSYSNGNADISGIFQSNSLEIDGDNSIFTTKTSSVHGDSASYDEISSENISTNNQVTSGSSGAIFSTTTEVDINTSEFASSFQQAF